MQLFGFIGKYKRTDYRFQDNVCNARDVNTKYLLYIQYLAPCSIYTYISCFLQMLATSNTHVVWVTSHQNIHHKIYSSHLHQGLSNQQAYPCGCIRSKCKDCRASIGQNVNEEIQIFHLVQMKKYGLLELLMQVKRIVRNSRRKWTNDNIIKLFR